MRTLGERIRLLRKQQKLTLEACAGEQMTKGMLSLIENNKANPSMENLNYLAKRLEVDVSELWDDISGDELSALLDETENLYKSNEQEKQMKVLELIEPILPKLTKGYESARLLEIYSKIAYHLKRMDWQESADKASAIFHDLNILPRRIAMGVFRAGVLFNEHRYEEARDRLLEERTEIERKSGYIDALTKLDLDVHEVIFRFAVNETEEATQVMEEAIAYSKENLIFYQSGQLYRLAAYQAVIDGDEEKLSYYEQKILEYGKFAEDRHAPWFVEIMRIHQLNSFRQDYKGALKRLYAMPEIPSGEDFFYSFTLLERGKALYGVGQFEEALTLLEKVVISEELHHPFDLSIYYEKDAYAALCAAELGDVQRANELATLAEYNMKQMPESSYSQFVEETVKSIRNLMNSK